jgi:hypothetical protein
MPSVRRARRHSLPAFVLLPMTLWLFLCRSSPPARGTTELASYLPADGESGEWRLEGCPQEFKGDDLYLYIDGGAEIYREYGFDSVLVQDYRNQEGKTLSLEIFRMADPESAFGMYTFKRTAKGESVDLGAGGRLEGYYLNFWKGRCVVTLTGLADDPTVRQALVQLGRSVAEKIPGPSTIPALTRVLPSKDLVAGSLRYFKGYLGFMNSYPSLDSGAFTVEEGVKGDFASGASLFVLRHPSQTEAARCYQAVEVAVKSDPRAKEFASPGPFFFYAFDDQGKRLNVRASGDVLLVCLEGRTSDEAAPLFEAVLKRR